MASLPVQNPGSEDLNTDQPPPAIVSGDEEVHFWPTDSPEEQQNLSELLQSDFESLNVLGVNMTGPRMVCTGCGKLPGFDDVVSTALKVGAHTAKDMVNAIRSGGNLPSNQHENVYCYKCGEAWPRGRGWPRWGGWLVRGPPIGSDIPFDE
ncbi:hypothetical protein TWF102_010174 [Orbilia oligospora]|uniref:Uncharacterized protein n=1 Tax=Orbilia oligospora TaxID=2813651 RepID=A0A7C8J1W5_ORBOL|nr:hypothetical protein TWF102_010174 [Orbilia oligospora]KAF3093302.1 hypothetical protein TWF103_011054 [Orbilia oligospora]KAF3102959.1 hypothetical protein TWF706_005082 [Orbilia oligospora]